MFFVISKDILVFDKKGEILISAAEKWTVFEGTTEIDPGVHQICFRYEGEKKVDLLEFELL